MIKEVTPQQNLERTKRLEALYIKDGRDKKDHPMHGLFTGLHQKYNGEKTDA